MWIIAFLTCVTVHVCASPYESPGFHDSGFDDVSNENSFADDALDGIPYLDAEFQGNPIQIAQGDGPVFNGNGVTFGGESSPPEEQQVPPDGQVPVQEPSVPAPLPVVPNAAPEIPAPQPPSGSSPPNGKPCKTFDVSSSLIPIKFSSLI